MNNKVTRSPSIMASNALYNDYTSLVGIVKSKSHKIVTNTVHNTG